MQNILRRDNIASRRKALAMAKPTKNRRSGLCIHTKNGKKKKSVKNPVAKAVLIRYGDRGVFQKKLKNPKI